MNVHIDTLETSLAKKVLGENITSELFSLVRFICRASLQGHVCVFINDEEILPHPKQLFKEYEQILVDVKEAVKNLPSSLCDIVNINDIKPQKPLCKHGDYYYFQRYWIEELKIFQALHNIINKTPAYSIEFESNASLNQEQESAVKNASKNCLTVICGGPGTGKTFTAGQLLKMLWKNLSSEVKSHYEIILAAPTGKAASNLESSFKIATSSLENFPQIKAKTLHSLLSKMTSRYLAADLLIIDECSMIDVEIMGKLLSAVKPGARIILLGDPNQLPPVETGSIFSDIVNFLKNSSLIIELKTCLRTNVDNLLNFANFVRDGRPTDAINLLKDQDCLFPLKSTDDFLPMINFPFEYNEENFDTVFQNFQRFRVLSPLREGIFGVTRLNEIIFNFLRKNKQYAKCVIPIMILKNDYQLGLFNGETGLLVTHLNRNDEFEIQKNDFAVFLGPNNELRYLPALLLPKFEFAYCLSVHKSQGSEYDEVMLLIPENLANFSREMIYTAATRAKKKLTVVGDEVSIQKAIERKCFRLSGLFLNTKLEITINI